VVIFTANYLITGREKKMVQTYHAPEKRSWTFMNAVLLTMFHGTEI
jgi:hypothetical protein